MSKTNCPYCGGEKKGWRETCGKLPCEQELVRLFSLQYPKDTFIVHSTESGPHVSYGRQYRKHDHE